MSGKPQDVTFHQVKDVVRKQVEDRNQKEGTRRFNGSLELRTVRGRDRERERAKTETLLQKGSNSMFCTSVCVQCTLLYKSLQGLTEVLSYFNALKERLH